MPGQKMKIGPWPAGLNQRDDSRMIEDKELATVLNFDITNEGVLRPRRPCRVTGGTALPAGTKHLMGTYIGSGGNTSGVLSIFDGTNSTFKYIQDTTVSAIDAFLNPTRAGEFKAIVQYNGFVWTIPATATTVGFKATDIASAPTDVATIPYGDYAFMLKDRMFIVRKATNRIYFSKPTDPSVWASPDGGFFDVNPGDGQTITKVVVTGNQVTIFKRESTYIFQFSEDPTTDGGLRQVSPDQGAFDAIVYNNEIYCVNARSVFKFINGYFVDIGSKIDLYSDSNLDRAFSPTCRLSVVHKTLLLGPAYNIKRAQDSWYAMNLDNGAWSEHYYPGTDAAPSSNSINVRSTFGAWALYGEGTAGQLCSIPIELTDEVLDVSTAGTVYPSYEFATKEMSLGDYEEWKRLHAWAIEVSPPASAVVITPSPTTVVVVNGTIPVPGAQVSLDTIDLINTVSTRFRRLQFQYAGHRVGGVLCNIPTDTDKTLKVAPLFYSITTWASIKSKVVT